MRNIFAAVVLFVLALVSNYFLERVVNRAPEWFRDLLATTFVWGGVLVIIVSDIVWPHVWGPRATPAMSTAIVSVAGAVLAGSTWWFFVVDKQSKSRVTSPPIIVSATAVQAYKNADGQIHLGRDKDQDNSYVVLATFRNQPTPNVPGRVVRLSASVTWRNLDPIGTGFWLHSESPYVDLRYNSEESIALMYIVPWTPMAVRTRAAEYGHASLIRDDRTAASREITYITSHTGLGKKPPGTPEAVEVLIVTVAEEGRVLGRPQIEVRIHGASAPDVKLLSSRVLSDA